MVSTPLRSKILSHTRSSSLPSRSHPLIPQFNDHLQRLQSNDSTSQSLLSIAKKLPNLEHLYNCVDDLLLLHHTRQVFARECDEKWVEELLDGYLGLVDACATAKDFVFHAKENVLDLLSLLRRKRDSDELSGFLNSRKTTKKKIQKSLRNITALKNTPSVVALDRNQETIAVISMLKEAESATLDLIESLLLSLSGTKSSCRLGSWTLVSRLMNPRKDHKEILEFGEIDAALDKIVNFRTSRCDLGVQIDELQQQLRDTDASLHVIEDKLENLFKRLIKTRVSLLNMHSQ